MFDNCGASPTRWAQFDSEWHVDFEFRQDRNHHPVPVCMHGYEEHSGTDLWFDRAQLLTMRRPPFGIGPRDLMIAYASNAEISCFIALGWPFPRNIIDPYVEVSAFINGRTDLDLWEDKRPSLLEALGLFGLPARSKAHKDAMRDLILGHEDYSPEQWRQIELYNREDTADTRLLLAKFRPYVDVPRALFRGRYMVCVACMDWVGLPVDLSYLHPLIEQWEPLRRYYIARDDTLGLYANDDFYGNLAVLIDRERWDWPRTPTGRLAIDSKTLGQQARRYPILKPIAHLRDTIAELRINKLINTIGADGFSRCPMMPFWTITGRNQPKGKDKMFLPGLPAWLRGLLAPPPGWALIELDWDAQEIGLMAGLSGDPQMIEDYRSGDPHWGFGVRAGLVPTGAKKADFREMREKQFKPVVLGMNYGMTPYGIAARTGKSLQWGRDMHARHHHTYPVFHRYLGDFVAQATFDGVMMSPFGWPVAVTADTRKRTLMNFPAQSAGAEAMRIAAIAATEAGIRVCAPVHDAFWILAPIEQVDATIAQMQDFMTRAGAAVSGGLPITASVKIKVLAPANLGAVRQSTDKGFAMWSEVQGLLNGALHRQTGT